MSKTTFNELQQQHDWLQSVVSKRNKDLNELRVHINKLVAITQQQSCELQALTYAEHMRLGKRSKLDPSVPLAPSACSYSVAHSPVCPSKGIGRECDVRTGSGRSQ